MQEGKWHESGPFKICVLFTVSGWFGWCMVYID